MIEIKDRDGTIRAVLVETEIASATIAFSDNGDCGAHLLIEQTSRLPIVVPLMDFDDAAQALAALVEVLKGPA